MGLVAGRDGPNADNLLLPHNESPPNLSVFKQSLTLKVNMGQGFWEGLSLAVMVQVFHAVAVRYGWSSNSRAQMWQELARHLNLFM